MRPGAHVTLVHVIVLAIVQGVTEFLPISSSAHLVLIPAVTDWQDQGLTMDVAVHVGTLCAVILYFWRDLLAMAVGVLRLASGRVTTAASLLMKIVIATLPVMVAGYAVNRYAIDILRSIEVIAWATIGFGVLLYIADRVGMTVRRLEHLTVVQALIIGMFQALALIPGTSRSGITITAARLLGYERTDAARFSLLIAIPAIAGAGTLKGYELYRLGDVQLTEMALVAAGLAFVAAIAAIAAMMAWLRRMSFAPFVAYRVALGIALLVWLYGYGAGPIGGGP